MEKALKAKLFGLGTCSLLNAEGKATIEADFDFIKIMWSSQIESEIGGQLKGLTLSTADLQVRTANQKRIHTGMSNENGTLTNKYYCNKGILN